VNRRDLLKNGSFGALGLWSTRYLPGVLLASPEHAEEPTTVIPNTNWADPAMGATVTASSGSGGGNVFGKYLSICWQTGGEIAGSWIQINFDQGREVSELWFLSEPVPTDILGQDIYNMLHSRADKRAPAKKISILLSDGSVYTSSLRQGVTYFQIFTLPEQRQTKFVRIRIDEAWPKATATDTGLGKIRVFARKHPLTFDVTVHPMYEVHNGRAVQAATLSFINPGNALSSCSLQVRQDSNPLVTTGIETIPACANYQESAWIPAPFEDTQMEFAITSPSAKYNLRRILQVPRYHSYFDGGTFELNCTNHNDMGWLDTQVITADFRSAWLIVPALKQMREFPEFMYSMECTTYLMEFLQRHPEMRDEMAERMRGNRFTWGGAYTNLLEVSVGPEKLVRQFYLGRRWLKNTFPGVDTRYYVQADPPQMSLQMAQVLVKAGIKYCLLGRFPWGFYNWRSPDGSIVKTRGFLYSGPTPWLDPKDNSGWLRLSAEREELYKTNHFPRIFIYDYDSDYLPPQPDLVPYTRRQNKSMEGFASIWNAHFAGDKTRQIKPPRILFTTPEASFEEFMAAGPDLPTLYGDWPMNWAYYDEPANREALLDGRIGHNELLAAERLYAGLRTRSGFAGYPGQVFANAWQANLWPDHGWGGNHGTVTDRVYAESYAKSRKLAGELLAGEGSKLAAGLPRKAGSQIPIAVYNCLSWSRSDAVECNVTIPADWRGWKLVDEKGAEMPCELLEDGFAGGKSRIVFVARDVPAVGYRCYFLERGGTVPKSDAVSGNETMENDFLRVTFGKGGIKSLFDKKKQWEVLRTDKFDGGEVLQFTAPGIVLENPEKVTMQNFDRTSNHEFRFTQTRKSPVGTIAIREAHFSDFVLRESFHLYNELDRLDIEIDLVDWSGKKERELRVAFPVNLDEARLSYEVPFGTVEMGKDELDFSLLPSNVDSQFNNKFYGGAHPIPFREAINWIDASSPHSYSMGCLAASDSTLHIFQDETDHPVSYPVLQHVLLSSRKSVGWNPEYWCTQAGNHRYRMALMPHAEGWRRRYRDAIGFNYQLMAFADNNKTAGTVPLPMQDSFLSIDPVNLVLTAMKKSEDDDRIVIRFYEAEGNKCTARIRLAVPIRHACKANLIEEDEETITPLEDGSLQLQVGPWEIVTVKVTV